MQMNTLIDAPTRQQHGDARIGRCLDVLLDTRTGRLLYAYFDLGGWLVGQPVVLSADRLGVDQGDITVTLTDMELEERRNNSEALQDAGGPLDLTAMPPVVVGPFGYSVAPVMGAAMLNSMSVQERPNRPDLDEKHVDWHWYSALRGLPVFDSAGPVGALTDILISDGLSHCTHLVCVDDSGKQTCFAFDKLRNVPRAAQSLIVELSDPAPYAAAALQQGA